MPDTSLSWYAGNMARSDRKLLGTIARMPFIDSAELAGILGEPHTTVHRRLTGLLAEGIAGRVSHGTAHLPSSHRYYLAARGIREASEGLGFGTSSDFVRAYPMSREWLTLLMGRMGAVASVYRLAACLSPGIDGFQSRIEFHRRGRFDAAITLHDGRSFGGVRQDLALRRRLLYGPQPAIEQYDYSHRPDTALALVPSVWEQRLTGRFCERIYLRDFFVAVESRDALERRDLRLWCEPTGLLGLNNYTLETVVSYGKRGGGIGIQSPERKRASLPDAERMAQVEPVFGIIKEQQGARRFLLSGLANVAAE